MSYEPSSFEVFFTVTLGTLFGGMYKEYVDRLGLKGGERVLDFGSGSGNPARFIAPLLTDGGRLTCVDVSERWMDVAQKRLRKYSNVEFKLGDIAALDLPEAGYDVVFVHLVLHDIAAADHPRIVQHLARKLKRDGRLFIREPMRFISPDEIRPLMRQNGLEEAASSITNIWSSNTWARSR